MTLEELIMELPCMVVLVILLRAIRLFIKSRDLFPLITGFLFSMDTETRLFHNEHIRCLFSL